MAFLAVLAKWAMDPRVWIALFIAGLLATTAALSAGLHLAVAAQHDPVTKALWRDEYRSDHAALAIANVNLATETSNASTFKADLDAQQASVKALEAQGAADTAAAEKRAQTASAEASTADANAARILAIKSGPDQCKSADDLILGSLPK